MIKNKKRGITAIVIITVIVVGAAIGIVIQSKHQKHEENKKNKLSYNFELDHAEKLHGLTFKPPKGWEKSLANNQISYHRYNDGTYTGGCSYMYAGKKKSISSSDLQEFCIGLSEVSEFKGLSNDDPTEILVNGAEKAYKTYFKYSDGEGIVYLILAKNHLFTMLTVSEYGEIEENIANKLLDGMDFVSYKKPPKKANIYDKAIIKDELSGSGEKIGEVSIIKAKSTDITNKVFNDWYFNYVKDSDYEYYLIIYTDHDSKGIYACGEIVLKDCTIGESDTGDGVPMLGANDGISYTPRNGKLVKD